METFIFVGGFILIVVVFIGISIITRSSRQSQLNRLNQSRNERREKLNNVSRTLGMAFSQTSIENLNVSLKDFTLYNREKFTDAIDVSSKVSENFLEGNYHRTKWIIFDFQYQDTWDPKKFHYGKFTFATVFCAILDDRILPKLTMASTKLPSSGLKFPGHKKFSERYDVRGEDENAVRSLLSSDILNSLEEDKFPRFSIETCGNMIIFYKLQDEYSQKTPPDKLAEHLNEFTRIVGLLKQGR